MAVCWRVVSGSTAVILTRAACPAEATRPLTWLMNICAASESAPASSGVNTSGAGSSPPSTRILRPAARRLDANFTQGSHIPIDRSLADLKAGRKIVCAHAPTLLELQEDAEETIDSI